MGIGGAPEGVITAAALRCLHGEMGRKAGGEYAGTREAAGQGTWESATRRGSYTARDLAPGEQIIFAGLWGHGGCATPRSQRFFRRRVANAYLDHDLDVEQGAVRRYGAHEQRAGAPRRALVLNALLGVRQFRFEGSARSRRRFLSGSSFPRGTYGSGGSGEKRMAGPVCLWYAFRRSRATSQQSSLRRGGCAMAVVAEPFLPRVSGTPGYRSGLHFGQERRAQTRSTRISSGTSR